MVTATIKRWSDFQHYKSRCPPWIKLERKLLDNFEFACLPLASKALAPMLWLLASESMDGSVRIDPDWLAFRLRFTLADIEAGLTPLIDKGFLILASGVLAPCLHDACLETEGETETEEKILSSGDDGLPAEPKPKAPAIPYDGILAAYHDALPMLPAIRLLTDARRKKIKSRWHELAERQTVEYWQKFFAYAAQSDFLTGRSGKWTSCNFDWLIEPGNHLKVVEGNYENRLAA